MNVNAINARNAMNANANAAANPGAGNGGYKFPLTKALVEGMTAGMNAYKADPARHDAEMLAAHCAAATPVNKAPAVPVAGSGTAEINLPPR